MIDIKRQSAWRFETAGTGGVGIDLIAAQGGVIKLFDPKGQETLFRFGAMGMGLSYGVRFPVIGKINIRVKGRGGGAALAPTVYPNRGAIFIANSFTRGELARSDLRGATLFLDGSLPLIAGISGMVMLLGIEPALLLLAAADPAALWSAITIAPAILVMVGTTTALQVDGGAAVYLGYLF